MSNQNPVLQNLRHLNQKFDDIGNQLNDFNRRQADGEMPDPAQFVDLLQKQSVTRTAMTAQFNLLQKPLKTVLNESK
ncbi:hypothetical protein PMI16_02115 [Herbaspirillum sp. CF444]|uniref:hypothetical protein n=1 Tax=Herbaspirillum sp. CF444 TaxID=1144319 RepID=UPI00027268B6|nr:hypothetical protein [Herbaspirillum sp. CF444]EJL88967.1 hypothetical protein PMI16_02115 [Herbaspirillum sp. CF444]